MNHKNKINQFWAGIPPWIFIGAFLVLVPIFAFMTYENIHRQKKNSARLLIEKGAALIRSFEAGTRTGLMGEFWNARQLQNLLTETALQPDITHLIVININGIVLAHNDMSQIGKVYGKGLNLRHLLQSHKLKWRMVKRPDEKRVFEVLRKFSPTGNPVGSNKALRMFQQLCQPHMSNWKNVGPSDYIIFVGLDMESIEEAAEADIQQTIVMASFLGLIGLAGILLLFLTHNYRAARASLSKIKAFSDNLVENMPIGLIAIDSHKRIASCNHVAESVFGFSSGTVIGKDIADVLPRMLWELVETSDIQREVVEREMDCLVDSENIIPLEVSASVLRDENDNFLGYILLFKDLSEVRILKKVIARNQRLASVGRLAAGVAHEIRNPLSSIKGFATYFKERYKNISEDEQTADIMIDEVDRLNRVVGQLLEFARPITISGKHTDLKSLVENSLLLVQKQAAEKNILIETGFSNDEMKAYVDPDRISQVLLNLYLNALESMEGGGTLSINLKVNDLKNDIEIHVSDTGCGMGENELQSVFDPYFTTKATGTGLGLAIVHNIIDAHHGEVKVESQKEQGSTFSIILPGILKEEQNDS